VPNILDSRKHTNVLLYFGPHPMTSQNCPEGPYFEVDGFWRRLLSNSGVLVTANILGLDVCDQALLEMRTQMLQVTALDSLRGDRKREIFQLKRFIGGNREEFGAIATFYAVVALLQLAMSNTLSILRDSLRPSLGALPNALSFEDEVVPIPAQVVIVMPDNARSLSAAKAPAILNERNRLGLDVFTANSETHVGMKDFLMQKTHRSQVATRLVLSQ